MSAGDHSLRLDLRAEPDCVAVGRHAVTTYARELGVADVGAVALTVSEAITNAVVHAYPDGEAQGITILAQRDERRNVLLVTIEDQGGGMKPRADSPGLGLGLPLMAQLTQRFEVLPTEDGGTRVRLSFLIDGASH